MGGHFRHNIFPAYIWENFVRQRILKVLINDTPLLSRHNCWMDRNKSQTDSLNKSIRFQTHVAYF